MGKLCIIPARGGSKRIPRKNIKDFLGKPIIAYSIEAALESGLFDEVMVSTDDDEIAKIAMEYGAKVPFIRSAENADDHASTFDVIAEVLKRYDKDFEMCCCIYPTAPLMNGDTLKEAYNKLIEGDFDSVFPVCKFSFPIQRALKIRDNKIEMFDPGQMNTRSQDLEHAFHDAGQFYWMNTAAILAQKKLWTNNSSFIELDEMMVQDIDNPSDWKLAELKYEVLNS